MCDLHATKPGVPNSSFSDNYSEDGHWTETCFMSHTNVNVLLFTHLKPQQGTDSFMNASLTSPIVRCQIYAA